MPGSDLIIAWVSKDGKVHFHDRNSRAYAMPEIDASQDWTLLEGRENGTHTIIKFRRPYYTCDEENDLPITKDTMRLIFAYDDRDPKDPNQVHIHERRQRGVKSAFLRFYKIPQQHFRDEGVELLDVTIKNVRKIISDSE